MSVTGRTYTSTRPRGLAPWKPRAEARELLAAVAMVLQEYIDHWPLTGRQVFYRLVAGGHLDKSERAYARLLENLNRGRRAGLVPWEAIRDDGVTLAAPSHFDGVPSFWSTVASAADRYRLDRSSRQPCRLELWVEAAGMVPQARRVADEYGVPVQSSGGFDSTTAKHDAALRFLGDQRPTVVLHIGDFDPSGCAIVDSVADDISNFVADYGRPDCARFERLAVTPEQIARFGLPTAPQKVTDRRGEAMVDTVQAEALSPDELARIIGDGIRSRLDLDALDDVLGLELLHRYELRDRLEGLAPEATQ